MPDEPRPSPSERYPAAEREHMIRRLLDIRVNGMRVGIYGADVCQLCARLGTFEGQIHAAAVHFGTLTDYVCERCRRGPDRPRRDMNEGRAWARAALERQPHRFCEVCRKPVDQIPANRRMRFWVCEACLVPLPEDAGRAISDLSHRRFLDKTRPGLDALRSFAITMARMRLDLQEAYVFGEERAQLKTTRRARGGAALEDLGFRRDPPEEPQPDPIYRP